MSLQKEIEKQLGVHASIKLGAPGALDIFANGKKVFSKKDTGHMPSPAEVVQLLRAAG